MTKAEKALMIELAECIRSDINSEYSNDIADKYYDDMNDDTHATLYRRAYAAVKLPLPRP